MKRKILIAALIFGVVFLSRSAWPDFGSFSGNSDYDTGSRSSSSSSSSSGSSSRSSSSGRSYSSGGGVSVPFSVGSIAPHHYYFSDSSTTEDEDAAILGAIVLVMVIYFVWKWRSAKKSGKSKSIILNAPTITLKPIEEYLSLDPNFDAEKIQDMLANLYVQMQNTWQAKDISSLRPYMTDKFYSQMDNQLEQFRKSGRTDYTERIAVLNVIVKGWRQSAGMDYITVGLNARIVSYVLDDRTGKLLSGDKNREKFMEYEIDLSRKSGTLTQPEQDGAKSETCPHCGAPLKLNASARCEYCGSVITRVNTDWAICAMRGISQRTA